MTYHSDLDNEQRAKRIFYCLGILLQYIMEGMFDSACVMQKSIDYHLSQVEIEDDKHRTLSEL